MQSNLKYYKSPDTLPIFNFNECRKGNLRYLYRLPIDDLPKECPDYFNEIFINILFELDEVDITLINLMFKSAKYENIYAITKDKKWLNKSKLAEAEYNRMINLSKANDFDFMKQVSKVEIFLKRDINVYKCPTSKYFGYLRQMRENG